MTLMASPRFKSSLAPPQRADRTLILSPPFSPPRTTSPALQRVILDGFKSYANRTVVDNFDTEFNAITGLNGSGKSNILDSICFVLGISNLSQVPNITHCLGASMAM